jgi:hypothetical protein
MEYEFQSSGSISSGRHTSMARQKINGKRASSNCLNQSITHVTPADRQLGMVEQSKYLP